MEKDDLYLKIVIDDINRFLRKHQLYFELETPTANAADLFLEREEETLSTELIGAICCKVVLDLNKEIIYDFYIDELADSTKAVSQFFKILPGVVESHCLAFLNIIKHLPQDEMEKLYIDPEDLYEEEDMEEDSEMEFDELNDKTYDLLFKRRRNFTGKITIHKQFSVMSQKQIAEIIHQLVEERELRINDDDIEFSEFYIDERTITFSYNMTVASDFIFKEAVELLEFVEYFENIQVGSIDSNFYMPDDHYISLMDTYRDMVFPEAESLEDVNRILEQFVNMSPEERRLSNPNPKEDDDYAAILLYEEPREIAIKKANQMLKSNPLNVEAKILQAGYEMDAEKRIEMLEQASDPAEQNFDYAMIEKDKAWWKVTETRPYMRAMFSYALSLQTGFYTLDAIDVYKDLLRMNPMDNQGVRFQLAEIYINEKDWKGLGQVINAYPHEENTMFFYSKAYILFLKTGRSGKSEKALIRAISSNLFLASAILDLDEEWIDEKFDIEKSTMDYWQEETIEIISCIEVFLKNREFKKYFERFVMVVYNGKI